MSRKSLLDAEMRDAVNKRIHIDMMKRMYAESRQALDEKDKSLYDQLLVADELNKAKIRNDSACVDLTKRVAGKAAE